VQVEPNFILTLAAHPRELWLAYYVQKMRPELRDSLPLLTGGRAQTRV
jgi:hypothetical protein